MWMQHRLSAIDYINHWFLKKNGFVYESLQEKIWIEDAPLGIREAIAWLLDTQLWI